MHRLFTVDHTTLYHCFKRINMKNPTVEINCISSQLALVVNGGIHMYR
jgi:hypothetical protein